MSSTSNAQNLLVNVFRPTYVYEAGVGYTPSLVMSNVDKVVSTTVVASNFVISDPGSNTYIGSNAGNAASNARASSNNVAIGYNAGNQFSNTSNTVAVGYNALGGALSNVSNTVAIGANTIGGGVNNIFIGHDTGTIGSNNIFIGAGQTPGVVSNQLRIGNSNNIAIAADMGTHYVGINNPEPVVEFDVSGQAYFRNKVGIQVEAPSKSLEVNGETYSSIGFLAGRGSVPQPSFAFYADPSTGLYSPGNGYGSFIANGAPYITFGGGTVNFHGRIVTDISGGGATANTITLSNGIFRDTSIGSILLDMSGGNIYVVGDTFTNNLIYSGAISNTNTNTSNVIGGVVLSNGDVSANSYNGPGGTANAPHYTFSDDRKTGLFFPGSNMLGFTAGGTERVRISNGNVGIGTTTPSNALDVSGVVRVIGGTSDITFSNGVVNAGSGINIAGTPVVSSTGAFVNGSSTSNQIGGVTLSNTNIVYAGMISNSISNTSNVIGGVVLSNGLVTAGSGSNRIGGVTLSASNVITGSGSNSVGGVTLNASNVITGSGSNSVGGVTLNASNVITGSGSNSVGGVTLNASNVITGSGSNSVGGVTLSNTDLTFAGTITGSTANTSNVIGGVLLSNGNIGFAINTTPPTYIRPTGFFSPGGTVSISNIDFSGTIVGSTANTSNVIGGVVLSNNNVSNSGTHTSSNFLGTNTASNLIGGVTLSNFDLSMSGTGRILGQTAVSNVVGGVVLSNNNINYSGAITGSTVSASNSIGGITLSNGVLRPTSIIGTANTSNTIGGVTLSNNTISNSGSTTSSNFFGTNTASNLIGGVTLSNFDLSMSGTGRILGQSNVSNVVGGIVLSNNTISNSSSTTSSNFFGTNTASNLIGGVTLSNFDLSMSGTGRILGQSNVSNVVGGIVLSNNTISNSSSTTSSNFFGTNTASNLIGGVTLSNFDLSMSGTGRILGQSNVSNVIGGVVLSNSNVIAGAGSVSAPSYTFAGDVSSGIYRPNASQLGFTTAGTQRICISGNLIGIGTSNPVYALDVTRHDDPNTNYITATFRAPATNQNQAAVNVVGGGWADASGLRLVHNPQSGFNFQGIFTSNSIPFYIWTNNIQRLTILSNGNVGIGRLNPVVSLDVSGDISNSGTHTSSNFLGTNAASNLVGGVTLSNFDLSMGGTGRILGQTAVSNVIGGIVLSNNNVSNSGTHTSSNFLGTNTASNLIGGVTLSNFDLSMSGTGRILGQTAVSNVIGGVVLSNNNVIAGAGSVSAPSHTFAGDTATGLYLPSTSQLGFTTAGTQRMCVSGDLIGIGTSNPVYALDVMRHGDPNTNFITATFRAPATNQQQAAVNVVGGGWSDASGIRLLHSPGATVQGIFTNNSLPFTIWTSNTRRMTILSNGNVGINYNTPAYPLDDAGVARIRTSGSNTTSTNTLIVQNDYYGGQNGGASYYLAGNILFAGGTTASTGDFYGVRIGAVLPPSSFQDRMCLGFYTANAANDNTSALRMIIASGADGGYVGIGTSSPAYALDICGELRISGSNAYKAGGGSWTATSDQRLKQNIQLADTSLCYSIVKNLPLKRFTWDSTYLPGLKDKRVVGWIAQEVEQVFPRAVESRPDYGFEDLRYLDVDQIYKTMYGALEKVIADKEALEDRVATLESQLLDVLTRLSNANL